MEIGRKIYYEKITGNIILDTGERSGDVVETTQEDDFLSYKLLIERTIESVKMIKLEYGQYAQDFAECSGYRINTETGALEFSYPDSNEDLKETIEPTYQKPLTEQIAMLQERMEVNEATILALLDFGI